jgi:ketosteroid isomerase-like protein
VIGALITKRKVASAFRALNRRDVDAFLHDWREDATKVFPGDLPISGEISGLMAMRDWYRQFLRQFPELRFTVRSIGVDRIWDVTGTNVATAHWELQARNGAGHRHYNTGVTVITVVRGKVVHVVDFVFDTGASFRTAWTAPEGS